MAVRCAERGERGTVARIARRVFQDYNSVVMMLFWQRGIGCQNRARYHALNAGGILVRWIRPVKASRHVGRAFNGPNAQFPGV